MTKQSWPKPIVLVVDDEPAILEALEDLLEEDFQVLKAAGGAEGLELLQRHSVAVVLSDQKMPGMKGEEFLARVAEAYVATRVLLTGYTDFDDLVRAVNRGHIYAFVSKPWSPHQLRSLVKAAAERFTLEKELVHEKNLLGLLLDHIPDLVSIKDHQGRYLRLNSACAKALRLDTAGDAIGKTDDELGGSLLAGAGEREREILTGGGPDNDRTEKGARSDRWYSTTRVATPSSEGSPLLIGISRDISERLESNRRLEAHARQLERINEEMSRFSFVVAHHLQEPVRTIAGLTDLLKRRDLLKEGAEEYFDYILESSRRARALMRDFGTYLDLRRAGSGEPVALQAAARQARDSVLAQHGQQESSIVVEGEATVSGHEELLVELFRALLDNAVVHGGGRAGEVRVSIVPEEEQVRVSVEDSGPGIPAEARARVFRLFETLETEGRSGLGLALCQKIVEQHGGEIWLEKGEPSGLRVQLTFSKKIPQTVARTGVDWERRCAELESRWERLNAFSMTASHDLHEPLRMVASYLSLLERRESARLSEDGRLNLRYALDGARRMQDLLNGLFAYSKSGKRLGGEPTPLRDLFSDVVRDLEVAIAEAGAQVSLYKEGGEDVRLGAVEGRLVLSNLIGNALKYRRAEAPAILLSARREGREVVITVADNGPGVPPEAAASIFEPFVRGDHDGGPRSAGLGLATCRQTVGAWGGRIWYEPNPGGGSLFRFSLPDR